MNFFSRMKINYIKVFIFSIFICCVFIHSHAQTDIYHQDKLNLSCENTANNLPQPTQSLLDKNNYQFIKLENGITALLISDKKAIKSFVSMNINAGSTQDPNNRLGLAHFLEHMVFIGSNKYPEPNNFANFIYKNNGSYNAYTSVNDTNYYYSINPNSLDESLEKLSQLLIDPSFDLQYIEKERHAVNSEHKKNILNDNAIMYETFDATANANNPSNKFTTGNLTTLHNENNSLQAELKTFFDRYYVANNMNLVIYSNHSINTLKKWVSNKFSPIKPGIKTENNTELYLNLNQQGVKINVQTVRDIDYLIMEFYIPLDKKNQFSASLEYIQTFLVSCFFNPLKDKNLIFNHILYYSPIKNDHIRYRFFLRLTKEGTKNIEEISAIFFDAIDYIKNSDIKHFIVDQLKTTKQQSFNYYTDPLTLNKISEYAYRMSHFDLEHILDVRYYYDDLNIECLNSMLNNFTWKNLRILVAGNKVPADTPLDFYNSKYKIVPFSDEFINRLENTQTQSYFKAPEPNSFIANNLSIKTKPKYKSPKKIVDDKGIQSWYMPDNQFNIPTGNINILLSNTLPLQSAEDAVLNIIYVNIITEALQNPIYLASEAKINSSINSELNGVSIKINGFQDKQLEILKLYLQQLKEESIDTTKFTIIKEKIIDSLANQQFLQPYNIVDLKFKKIFNPDVFADDELIAATKKITLNDLNKFITNFYRQINIQMLVYGNYTENEAYDITNTVKNSILTNNNAINKPLSARRLIDDNIVFSSEINNNNSCCFNCYRIIDNNFSRSHALAYLTTLILKANFFKELRTEEQIGYIVWNNMAFNAYQPWVSFTVQSDVKNPEYIAKRIDTFLADQIVKLETMTNKEFNTYKNNLIKTLSQPPLTSVDAINDIWFNLIYYNDFSVNYHTAQALKQVIKQDIIDLVKNLTTQANSISIQLWSNQDKINKANADKNQNALTEIKQLDKYSIIRY